MSDDDFQVFFSVMISLFCIYKHISNEYSTYVCNLIVEG